MLVEVIKNNYVIVLAENDRDIRWLDQSGYTKLGEDYYQQLFKDIDELVSEVNYLLDNNAEFLDSTDSDSPLGFLNKLKAEGLI